MNEINRNQSLEAAAKQYSQDIQKKKQTSKNKFKELLQDKLQTGDIKVSKHAQEKLRTRGIKFDQQEMDKLQKAVAKGKEKGAKESLVLMDDNAYIVSVENKTVITAMTKDSMQEDVVTNIDSAIMMK